MKVVSSSFLFLDAERVQQMKKYEYLSTNDQLDVERDAYVKRQ
jgi:hypothetical protein